MNINDGLPIAVSQGEPAGIGPELALMAWLARAEQTIPPFALFGDAEFLRRRAREAGLDAPIQETTLENAARIFSSALPVISTGHAVAGTPGQPSATDAPAVIAAIEQSVAAVMQGQARAVVTAPIAKAPLMAQGFPFPGHTEFLGALAQKHGAAAAQPVMMLWCEELAVVPVTVHVPLKDVPGLLTQERIVETGRIVDDHLKRWFGIASPRIAVAGLNPHAGEDGMLGHEDRDVIAPAIAQLRGEGIDARGPFPADTLFHAAARAGYDAVLAMYHDQGLIPIKTLAFDRGVNLTLGLPFVRTSPDHGTAFDIAGKGTANPASFIAALRLAHRLSATP